MRLAAELEFLSKIELIISTNCLFNILDFSHFCYIMLKHVFNSILQSSGATWASCARAPHLNVNQSSIFVELQKRYVSSILLYKRSHSGCNYFLNHLHCLTIIWHNLSIIGAISDFIVEDGQILFKMCVNRLDYLLLEPIPLKGFQFRDTYKVLRKENSCNSWDLEKTYR